MSMQINLTTSVVSVVVIDTLQPCDLPAKMHRH